MNNQLSSNGTNGGILFGTFTGSTSSAVPVQTAPFSEPSFSFSPPTKEVKGSLSDLVTWLSMNDSLYCLKMITNHPVEATVLRGLPAYSNIKGEPWFDELFMCVGLTSAAYRAEVKKEASVPRKPELIRGMGPIDIFSCCIISMLHHRNFLVISGNTCEYYFFQSDPNQMETCVICVQEVGLKTGKYRFARVNATEVGLSSVCRRVLVPCTVLLDQPVDMTLSTCEIMSIHPFEDDETGKITFIKTPIYALDLAKNILEQLFAKGMTNVPTLDKGAAVEECEAGEAKRRRFLSDEVAKVRADMVTEALQKGMKLNIDGASSRFTIPKPTQSLVTSKVNRDLLKKTKMPVNTEANRQEWLLEGARLSDQIRIGVKPKEVKMTGLRHWYSCIVMNYKKKAMVKEGYNVATYLPGGLLIGTGLGNSVCCEIVWTPCAIIARYEIFNIGNERTRSIISINETSSCNVPGRPFLGYCHIKGKWFTSDLFTRYFEVDLQKKELAVLVQILTSMTATVLSPSLTYNEGMRIKQAIEMTNRDRPFRMRNKQANAHPLRLVPIIHTKVKAMVQTRGDVELSALSSVWPSVSGEDYSKDNDVFIEGERVPGPGVQPDDLRRHSFLSNCAWREHFQVLPDRYLMPCGTTEPKINHRLYDHQCMYSYLGEMSENCDERGFTHEQIPSCDRCNRYYPHPAMAGLCAIFGCPGGEGDILNYGVQINHLLPQRL
ncbi:non-structural protein NSP5 [Raspberry latent virus]|uniref:non-structural protein NSP5 n=1 Tax=Raspberry latent virus TaxID=907191 RepID=UPI0001E6901C|nr:non-structural protein NSP5 [Raspberry latent virus]ADO27691.1 non-structural protein NSP5 [Raspberry latent virus]